MRRTTELITVLAVQNAAHFAPSPAPPGFHWVFVTDNGVQVKDGQQPVVDLIGN